MVSYTFVLYLPSLINLFSSAQLDDNLNVVLQDANAESILDQFVSVAHAHVSPHFLWLLLFVFTYCPECQSPCGCRRQWQLHLLVFLCCHTQNRSTFAANVTRFAHVHDMDGIVLECVYNYLFSTLVPTDLTR